MKTKRLIRAAALTLLSATLFLLSSCGFSYEKSDLKRYVNLAREDYYGITVSIPEAKSVTQADIDKWIETFRLKLRTLVSEKETTRHAQWGDNVNLYFCFLIRSEGGAYLTPENYSNMTYGTPYPFVLGGGGFLPSAFETALYDHAALETVFSPTTDETAAVAAADVVYLDLTYRCLDGDKTITGSPRGVRVDLASPGAAGETVVSALVGRHPGEEFDFGMSEGEPLVADWDGDGENETLSVSGVVRLISRGEVLGRIEGSFPDDYEDAALAGKNAVMLYAIDSVDVYSVPELTEELLREYVPGFTPSEGGDRNEEFRGYVYDLLLNESRREWHATIEEKLWEYFDALDCIKKYPSRALRDEIKEQERQLERLYAFYGALYEEQYGVNPFSSVEEFGYDYYALDGTEYSDVHEYLKKAAAPGTVKQKLIVYFIADREGWKITAEDYETELPRQLAYYAETDGITSEEALRKYGEAFFRQAIQYNKVLTNLVEATIIE